MTASSIEGGKRFLGLFLLMTASIEVIKHHNIYMIVCGNAGRTKQCVHPLCRIEYHRPYLRTHLVGRHRCVSPSARAAVVLLEQVANRPVLCDGRWVLCVTRARGVVDRKRHYIIYILLLRRELNSEKIYEYASREKRRRARRRTRGGGLGGDGPGGGVVNL